MKIRDRLPFRQGSADPVDSQQPAVASPESQSEPQPENTAEQPAQDKGALASALESVAGIVDGEIDSLRNTMGGLDAKLTTRLDADKRETREAIEKNWTDVLERLDDIRKAQQKAVNEIREETKKAVAGLRELVERTRTQVDDRSTEVREGLQKLLTQKEHKIAEELDTLSNGLAGLRVDLQKQAQSSGQVAHLLDNVANVFAGQPNLKQTAEREPASEPKRG